MTQERDRQETVRRANKIQKMLGTVSRRDQLDDSASRFEFILSGEPLRRGGKLNRSNHE
jgi:hypothetical protein